MSTSSREARTAVMIVVEVSWEESPGTVRSISARMEDKSPSGACLRVKTPIELGARLKVQSRYEHFSGVVRYCRVENWDYVVGIQREVQRDKRDSLTDSQPWRSDELQPTASKSSANIAAAIETPTIVPNEVRSESRGEVSSEVQTNVQIVPDVDANTAIQVPAIKPVVETEAVVVKANRDAARSPSGNRPQRNRENGREIGNRDGTGLSDREELETVRRTGIAITPRAKGKEVPKERISIFMARKWLELAPWQRNREREIAQAGNDGSANGKSEQENPMVEETASANEAARENEPENTAGFQVELLPMEEVYRAAGIMSPQKGYSIHKVVEMLNSEHIRGLSKEMRRAAVLMALEAAGISIEQVQQDARSRQEALESYEAGQRKQVEAEWARKAENNIQIQEEMERVKARYMARVGRNLDTVAREKATFESWVSVKRQESENIAQVVDLCVKPQPCEPVSAPLAKTAGAGALGSASGKP